ncbi:MAG: 2-succinyl-5-enolpyruvyl-6-hydroxy-3-cyclohexene-1-carboxylic-acid synthase [Muribaculaceae bacterium]|nr:2-succinyl-5-enolpyruvyl-6-hydroxy-3-cyclohexene-1-carboxylic-acid synthase [Muribaculaceae bacterium]
MDKKPNTDKWTCRMVAKALAAYGVRHVVASPGSRNTPLLMAVARSGMLKVHSVVDERSAAFIALGMARVTGTPAALVCTSGSAMLNYGPALAEAYYSGVPLIAVTADRPDAWIDQADSQTIRQPGALPTVTKGAFSLDGEASDDETRWHTCRMLNDALTLATAAPAGPVQINVALSVPLTNETEEPEGEQFPKTDTIRIEHGLHNEQARRIAASLCNRRVLVVAGFMPPSARISEAMKTLAAQPNVAVLAEGLSNIHAKGVMEGFDAIIPDNDARLMEKPDITPDILITTGGSLVSAKLKGMLRRLKIAEHWHVGPEERCIDTFRHLTARFEMLPEEFFPKTANALAHLTRTRQNRECADYRNRWSAYRPHSELNPEGWNAVSATAALLENTPPEWDIQLSNGMSVRCALQFPLSRFHRVDCNRGVSGIDGSISTAVGAAYVSARPTLLITGDMSLQYDLGALTSTLLRPGLTIAVINNGGGGIFSYVGSTARLPERRELLQCNLRLPLRQIAEAWGLEYYRVETRGEIARAMEKAARAASRPVLIEIVTDAEADAQALTAATANR